MRVNLIAPIGDPSADLLRSFFQRRGDDVRLAGDDFDANADADLHIFYTTAPHSLSDAVYTLERGVVILVCQDDDARADADLLRLANAADLVVVEAAGAAQRLLAAGAAQSHRLYIVPPAVSLADFSPGPADTELCRELGLLGKRVLLASLPAAGATPLDELVDLFAHVRERVPNAALAVRGEESAALAPAAQADTTSVVRLPATVSAVQAYRLADVFLALDDSRAALQTALEAAACGLPLLEVRDGALRELLTVEPLAGGENAAGLAVRLLRDDAFYGAMVQRSLDLAARHSPEAFFQAWSNVADTACGRLPLRERTVEPAPAAASPPALAAHLPPLSPAEGWSIADDLAQLEAMAGVMLPDYEVRSPTPVVGPLIAWVRRNLTSHLREPYLDPTLRRQEAFNRRAVGALAEAVALLEQQRRRLDATQASMPALREHVARLAAQLDALLHALPDAMSAAEDAATARAVAELRDTLAEIQRLLAAQFTAPPGDDAP